MNGPVSPPRSVKNWQKQWRIRSPGPPHSLTPDAQQTWWVLFAEKTRGRTRKRTIRLLKGYADDPQYQQLFVRIVLTTQDVAKSLVDTALSMAAAWPQLLQGLSWCDEVPPATLKRLLTCNHPNVACKAAIGIWGSKEPEQVISEMRQDWEQAVIAGLCDSQTDGTVGHWIENILMTRPDFVEKCLGTILCMANDATLPYTALRVARKVAKGADKPTEVQADRSCNRRIVQYRPHDSPAGR